MIFPGRFLPSRDATIALAGVMRSLYWVHQLAAHGKGDSKRVQHSVDSILNTDPVNAEAVFGSTALLKEGVQCLEQILRARGELDLSAMEQALLTRYAGQVLRLGKRVRSDAAIADALAEGLAQVSEITASESGEETTGVSTDGLLRRQADALAKLYVIHISPLTPRLMVSGQPTYLRNDQFVADIRCHLLAAIRSAVLWHQCGGRLWQLFLLRRFWLRHLQTLSG